MTLEKIFQGRKLIEMLDFLIINDGISLSFDTLKSEFNLSGLELTYILNVLDEYGLLEEKTNYTDNGFESEYMLSDSDLAKKIKNLSDSIDIFRLEEKKDYGR